MEGVPGATSMAQGSRTADIPECADVVTPEANTESQ